ncbi:PH domain-containing protein [Blastococcus sp. LR1]|uniref:PH domain-containing protein n=1 Tax=Blastococcus sp. LR1 TaxID=2877000 RepID=UPI001CC8EDFD|nr:PH domain-containing protein [Blastococcus sp. LR1]MCA0146472.1 PH domain-containing protein [Blastococcus sp. LR1]
MEAPARLRMNRTALVPVALLALCVVPLAFAAPWLPVLLLIPVGVAAWVLRTGVDIDDEGLTLQALLGRRRVPWTDVAGIRVARRGDLWLVTTAGTELKLPVMRARDLPQLAALSGGRIPLSAQ